MTREQIERAAKEAVQNHFQCNGKYPCEERDCCMFCNGRNSAFDCNEGCGADSFSEGFFDGARWRISSVWHDADKEEPALWKLLVRKDRHGNFELGYEIKGDTASWAYMEDLIPSIP